MPSHNLNTSTAKQTKLHRNARGSVITFCFFNIAINVVLAIMSNQIADAEIDAMQPKAVEPEWFKKNMFIIILTNSAVSIIIHLVGLLAVFKEHFIMTSIYMILAAFASGSAIFEAIDSKRTYIVLFWMNAIWSIFATSFTCSYVILLKKARTAVNGGN